MFKLELQKLSELDPCSLDHFHKKAKGGITIEYPDGWLKSDSLRVAKENPIGFLWLVSKQAIPVPFTQANAILDEVYGKKAADEVRASFAKAGADRAAGKAKAKKAARAAAKAESQPVTSFLDSLKSFRSPEGSKPSAPTTTTKPSPDSIFERIETVSRGGRGSVLGKFLKR